MKYRILYCEKCGREYPMSLDLYGEKCKECGEKLSSAWKVEEKKFSCIAFWGLIIAEILIFLYWIAITDFCPLYYGVRCM